MITLSATARKKLHEIPGVNLVGLGDHKIVIGVEQQRYSANVPMFVDNVHTETITVGKIRALDEIHPGLKGFKGYAPQSIGPFRTGIYRPAPGGVSIGHKDITAGTLGCLTPDGLILSNNHVLANSNDADIGDPILQPGPYDGGTAEHKIATLHKFQPIVFANGDDDDSWCPLAKGVAGLCNLGARALRSQSRMKAVVPRDITYNLIDAALATPLEPAEDYVIPEILEVGTYTWADVSPEVGMTVKKSGRTTGLTESTITAIQASTVVGYGGGRIAYFADQIIFSNPNDSVLAGGDSGSALLTIADMTLGLCFAGSSAPDGVGIANWMRHVREGLNF